MPPRENSLGVPGQAADLAQHIQRLRQHTANTAGQQIYNNPTTAAGMDAQHRWHQNNPIPQQSTDTVYGGVNYGSKLQKDTEIAVDQEQIGRGGPGTASAMMRAGLLDANGYKPNTPGVNLRDTRSEADQYAHQDRVMADIKREGAEARARGEQFQPKGVNTVNPSRRVDISGDRRRTEKANGWAVGSMDQGGEHYADNGKRSAQLVQQNGPTGIPQAPVAAPTPPPVAQATPAPTGYQWKSKEAEALYNKGFVPGQYNGTPGSGDPYLSKMREQGVIRPDGSYNPNAQMSSQQQGPNSPQQSAAIDALNAKNKVGSSKGLPGGQQTTAELQASGQMAPRPAGRYGMTDEQWFNTPEGQKQAQAMKATRDKVLGPPDSEGSLDVEEQFPPAGIPGPDNPLGLPAPDVNFTPKAPPVGPKPIFDDPGEPQKLNDGYPLMRGGEDILAVKPQDAKMPAPPTLKPNPSFAPKPQRTPIRPIAPPSSGLRGSTTSPKFTPSIEGVNKMPKIKKSSPITDTIKASNTPIPEVNTPKPTQQPIAQRKPLFPRLGGRLRK